MLAALHPLSSALLCVLGVLARVGLGSDRGRTGGSPGLPPVRDNLCFSVHDQNPGICHLLFSIYYSPICSCVHIIHASQLAVKRNPHNAGFCATTSCGGPMRICHAEQSEASGHRRKSPRRIQSTYRSVARSFAGAQDDRTEAQAHENCLHTGLSRCDLRRLPESLPTAISVLHHGSVLGFAARGTYEGQTAFARAWVLAPGWPQMIKAGGFQTEGANPATGRSKTSSANRQDQVIILFEPSAVIPTFVPRTDRPHFPVEKKCILFRPVLSQRPPVDFPRRYFLLSGSFGWTVFFCESSIFPHQSW